jgi:chromosome segregation ATPase
MTRLEQRRLEWEAERRFLTAEIQRLKTRLNELEEILLVMFPEARHG